MAITWQSVGGPNFSDSNRLNVAAGATIASGLDRLSKTADNLNQQQKRDTHAEFQHNLLDLSMKAGLDKNEFLKRALVMSKENGLDPNQALKQIDTIRGVREQAEALDVDQQAEYDNMLNNLRVTQEEGQANINAQLSIFDNENPQVRRTATDVAAFHDGGGVSKSFADLREEILAQGGDDGDIEETTAAIEEVIQEGEFDPFVIGQTLKQMGPGEVGKLADGNLVNKRRLRKNLKYNQDLFAKYKENSNKRDELSVSLQRGLADNIRKLQDEAQQYRRSTQENNLRSFAF